MFNFNSKESKKLLFILGIGLGIILGIKLFIYTYDYNTKLNQLTQTRLKRLSQILVYNRQLNSLELDPLCWLQRVKTKVGVKKFSWHSRKENGAYYFDLEQVNLAKVILFFKYVEDNKQCRLVSFKLTKDELKGLHLKGELDCGGRVQ